MSDLFGNTESSDDYDASNIEVLEGLEPVRHRPGIEAVGEEVHIHAAARSFLHHQVRNMVGTLALVGSGKWQPDAVATALAACDRSAAGPTAPPEGLYLTAVSYPI